MKRLLASVLLVCMFSMTIAPKRADAAIGFIAKSRALKAIGGTVTGVGAITIGVAGLSASSIGWGALYLIVMGFYGGLLGLVILDDQDGNVSYNPLSKELAGELAINPEALAIYNSEVAELNSIKEIVEAKLTKDSTVEDAKSIWQEYSEYLSPETMEVAGIVSKHVLENLK
jgi:hypothetical protein